MRVLYIFRSLAVWGGIERILVDKMNNLVSQYDYDVYMLTTDQGSHSIPYNLDERVHLEDLDIRFHQKYQYNFIRRLLVARRLKVLYEKRLDQRLKEIQPDVIVCTTADMIDSIVKLKGKIPLVVESHSICLRTIEQRTFWFTKKLFRYFYLRTLSKASVVVALTEGDAKEWRKVHRHVVVIPNFVHLYKGQLSTLDKKRVIFVGRFDYQKQPLEIVRIWQKVYVKHPDWHLDIYGEGEQKQELEKLVVSLNINITLHQPTERIFERYIESSILVNTSLFEPFGLVIPEAMSCGLPVVAYDCPYGPADMIENGENGYLVDLNDIESFADKICILIENREQSRQIGKKGVLSVQRYEVSQIMPLWGDLFRNLVET